MKRLIVGLVLLGSFVSSSYATVQDQFMASLLTHVSATTEFNTHGQSQLEFTDSIIQFGHYQKDYIVALDAGFLGSATGPEMTYGIHLHVFQALAQFFNINPTYAPLLAQVEADPRYSYDMDTHSAKLGFTLGFVHSFQ